ncbi:hypothetical protein, partial [Butyricicoccus sp.]|uniref:hypothetical protein n=1 Tax=Butyricicoccus sp. TaxID=2049021 RepID=UPI003D7EE0D5
GGLLFVYPERADSDKLASSKSERIYSWYKPSLSLRDISPRGRAKFGLYTKVKSPAQAHHCTGAGDFLRPCNIL